MNEEMENWERFFKGFVALVAMTAVGLGFLVGLTEFLDWWFDDLVAASIVAGAAPIIASFSLSIWSDYRRRGEQLEVNRRSQRGKAYESFLNYLFDAITQLDDEATPDELELGADDYARFVQQMLVWGSDDLIELWNEFRDVDFADLTLHEQREWYGRLLEQVQRELRGAETALSWQELYRLYEFEQSRENGG